MPDALHEIGGLFFLLQDNHDTGAFLRDMRQRLVQRPGTGAMRRGDQIQQAFLHMHPHEYRPVTVDVAAHERQMHGIADVVMKGHDAEVAELRRHQAFTDTLDRGFMLRAVADEIGDGADLESMPPGELFQFRQARHGAVFIHDLANDARGFHPRQAREIHAGLGVSGARHPAAALRHRREDMPGLYDIARLGVAFDRRLNGARAVGGGNTGGDTLRCFDGNGEIGHAPVMRVADHERQLQLAATLLGQGEANQPAAVTHHEVHVFRARVHRGHHQVTFVFAVLVVHQHDHATAFYLVNNLGYRAYRHKSIKNSGIGRALSPIFAPDALISAKVKGGRSAPRLRSYSTPLSRWRERG